MKMEEMVEFLRRQGFDVKKEYNRVTRLYYFTITKYGITVTDDFEYPTGKNFVLKDKIQQDFLNNLIAVWENRILKNKKGEVSMARHEWMDPETGKKYGYSWGYDIKEKGESKMSNIKNLIRDLAINNKARLVYGNDIYNIVVRDAMTDCRPGETSNITITCDLVDDGFATYARKDVEMTSFLAKQLHTPKYICGGAMPKIKDVIFNPPATIVFWADNTKTVVKCQEGDDFDPEKGLTMAITKKIFGNKGNYCEEIKKWTKKYKPEPVELNIFELMSSPDFKQALADRLERVFGVRPEVEVKKAEPIVAETPETADPEGGCPFCKVEGNEKLVDFLNREREKKEDPEKRWKIWWKKHGVDGKVIGSGVHETDYDTESKALNSAVAMFIKSNPDHRFEWTVSQDNPWEEK